MSREKYEVFMNAMGELQKKYPELKILIYELVGSIQRLRYRETE